MVEGALDLVVFCMFASVCDFGHEAYNIVWPPAHHSRDWHEVLSISRLLVVVSALFLAMGYQRRKSWFKVYQPHSCIYVVFMRKLLKWFNTPAIEHFRRRGLALFVLQLLTGSLFIIDTDFLCALSFKIFIISSMINEAACQVLLMWWPWPSFYWCVGQAAVALVISVIGLGSLFTGLLLFIWPGRSWKARLCSTAYLWAVLVGMHAAIWLWKVILPESHSTVAQLWAGSSEVVFTRWMMELCAFHTSVRVMLLDEQQDDTEGNDTEVTRTASVASLTSSAFVASLGSGSEANNAALHPPLPADVSLTSNVAQLRSHMSSVAAVLTKLGVPQPTAAVGESQQASSPEDANPQVTEGDVCQLAQLLLESLQQLLQQQQQRHSTAVPLTESLGSDLAANEPLVPASPDLETPEVYTILADMAERTQNENLQDCEQDNDYCDTQEPVSEPLQRADDPHLASDRRDTDDQRRNAWSAKILKPAAASFKKAAKRLQPSEETKRDFHARRYHRAEKFVQRLHKACRILAPCF